MPSLSDRVLFSVLTLALVVTLAGCGQGGGSERGAALTVPVMETSSQKVAEEVPGAHIPCSAGFVQDAAGRCADIDECVSGVSRCDVNASCLNTPGTYSCVCNPGFKGDGVTCEPMVEKATPRLQPPARDFGADSDALSAPARVQTDTFCHLSGLKGSHAECALRVAREASERLPATGADLRLSWDGAIVAFEQLVDAYCASGTCWPIDALTCDEAGAGCVASPLSTGHQLILVPQDLADVSDWLSLTLVHPASVEAALSSAVKAPSDAASDDATVLRVRFRLLKDIPTTAPVPITLGDMNFDRVDSPLEAWVEAGPLGALIVTGGAP